VCEVDCPGEDVRLFSLVQQSRLLFRKAEVV
jgi:hypothetical protein